MAIKLRDYETSNKTGIVMKLVYLLIMDVIAPNITSLVNLRSEI